MLAIIALGAGSPIAAALDPSEAELAALEKRFYFHDYAKETIPARLSRLENFMFGVTRTGGVDERIAKLSQALPKTGSIAGGAIGQPAKTVASEPRSPAKATAPPVLPPSSSKYPAVSTIERKYFGRGYASEPVEQRLGRLEQRLFGQASSGDLSRRLDRIKQRSGVDVAMQDAGARQWTPDVVPADSAVSRRPPIANEPPRKPTPELSYSSAAEADPSVRMRRPGSAGGPMPAPSARTAPVSLPGPEQAGRLRSPGGSLASSTTPGIAPSLYRSQSLPRPAPQVVPFASSVRNSLPPAYGEAPRPAPPYGLAAHITTLEGEVFGRVYITDSLADRVSRLEAALFPQQPVRYLSALSTRVQRLLQVRGMRPPMTSQSFSPPFSSGPHSGGIPHNAPAFNLR